MAGGGSTRRRWHYLNMEYALTSLLVRALAGVALAGVCAIALQTAAGRSVWELAKEARIEIRRVVWPTRQETTQTTLIVVVMVILVAWLWMIDSGLSYIVSNIGGDRSLRAKILALAGVS